MDIPANGKMVTGLSVDVIPGPGSKSDATKTEVQDSVEHDAEPSREVSRKRQSLSDIFTIVGGPWISLRACTEDSTINECPCFYE
jgi:hypothetical protein